ncbi:hypothetical protein ACFV9D_27395 [Streptomyces sp. NPDC059875]|uniref:hypothetical protein n=1 Tax=unclassified Streptomyces TaxID=2593676 RepID=UPI00365BD201
MQQIELLGHLLPTQSISLGAGPQISSRPACLSARRDQRKILSLPLHLEARSGKLRIALTRSDRSDLQATKGPIPRPTSAGGYCFRHCRQGVEMHHHCTLGVTVSRSVGLLAIEEVMDTWAAGSEGVEWWFGNGDQESPAG